MNEEERWHLLVVLDDELLTGGVILSEWCSFITREADTAFAKGAYLASILASVSAIETHLRSENMQTGRKRLVELIDSAGLKPELAQDLHKLRRYRNKWVHVEAPWDDEALVEDPGRYEKELEEMAFVAVKALRQTIYFYQWV
ncbi:hypothetical protein [Edaphobacter aggregans]|uniref:hypothetical protein n=1 Tax=Edaphobacter aggregans TaxID=570835 RepID=UPI00055386FB|nr:hypothetical protein [Edaphobacter aggregans]